MMGQAALARTAVVLMACTSGALAVAAPASAGGATPQACPVEVSYGATGPYAGWKVSNTASWWAAGPSTISYSVSEEATTTYSASLSGGASVDGTLAVAALEAVVSSDLGYGAGLETSTSRSATWTYEISIPAGKSGRAVVSTQSYRATLIKYVDSSNCTTSTYSGSISAPKPFTSRTACIFRDIWPATTWQTSSGGCRSES